MNALTADELKELAPQLLADEEIIETDHCTYIRVAVVTTATHEVVWSPSYPVFETLDMGEWQHDYLIEPTGHVYLWGEEKHHNGQSYSEIWVKQYPHETDEVAQHWITWAKEWADLANKMQSLLAGL